MSITEGWLPKDPKAFCPGIEIKFDLTMTDDAIYLDNGQEYKKFPNTTPGWMDCCEALMDLEPFGRPMP